MQVEPIKSGAGRQVRTARPYTNDGGGGVTAHLRNGSELPVLRRRVRYVHRAARASVSPGDTRTSVRERAHGSGPAPRLTPATPQTAAPCPLRANASGSERRSAPCKRMPWVRDPLLASRSRRGPSGIQEGGPPTPAVMVERQVENPPARAARDMPTVLVDLRAALGPIPERWSGAAGSPSNPRTRAR